MEPINDFEQNQFEEEIIFDDDDSDYGGDSLMSKTSPNIEEFKKKLNSKLQTGLFMAPSPVSSPQKKLMTFTPPNPSQHFQVGGTPPISPIAKQHTQNIKIEGSSNDESLLNQSLGSPGKDGKPVLKKSSSEKFQIKFFKKKEKKMKGGESSTESTPTKQSPSSLSASTPSLPPFSLSSPGRGQPSPIQSSSKSFSVPKLPISPSVGGGAKTGGQQNNNVVPELSLLKLHSSFDNSLIHHGNSNGDSNESTSHSLSDGRLTPESDLKLAEIASRPPTTPRLTHESKSIPSEISLKIIFRSESTGPIEKVLKFSPCSTIEEILSVIIPNLMFHKGLQNVRQQSTTGEWESSSASIGADTPVPEKDHHSFSLFRPYDDDLNIDLAAPLHKESTLIELGLQDQEILILKTVVLNIIFVKITIPNFTDSKLSAQATLKLNQFTSVRSIIRKLYLKFHKSIDVSSHGIFLIRSEHEHILLEEDELFSSYQITPASKLIFKHESEEPELGQEDSLNLSSSSIFKTLKLKILILTAFSRYNYLTLSFDPSCTVSKAIKITGLRTGLLDSLNKCGFYLTPSEDDDDGFWMDEDLTLDSYHLKHLTLLEFKERCRKYIVNIKASERYCTFKFDQFVKVSTMFNIILNNEAIENAKDYYLCTKDGTSLELERYLWSYDINSEIEFKELPNKVLLFNQNGEKNLVYVDFNDPIRDVVTRLSQNLSALSSSLGSSSVLAKEAGSGSSTPVPGGRERSYTIKRLGHLVNNIDVRKSLKAQGIQPNDPLVLEELRATEENPTNQSNVITVAETAQTESDKDQPNPGEELQAEKQLNIWSEPVDSNENIIYSNRKEPDNPHHPLAIEAGTLNKLIIRLTSGDAHDLMFMKTLLMTYKAYTNSITLLKKLFERFQIPGDSDLDEKEKQSIQLRVGNVIKYWVEHHYEDFDFESTKFMVDFVDTYMMSAFPALGNQIRSFILKRTCGIKTLDFSSSQSGAPGRSAIVSLSSSLPINFGSNGGAKSSSNNSSNNSSPSLSSSLTSSTNSSTPNSKNQSPELSLRYSQKFPETKTKGLSNPRSLFDFDDEEIARQLTLYEFSLYSSIKPTEFLNQAWNKPNIASRRSPMILQMISRFNDVGLWVVKLILDPERVKTRAKRMERIIKIAEKLRELKNYNTLMSFIGGLNNSAILRLKYTRGLVSKKYLDILDNLEKEMSCEGSYKSYRVLLHNTDPPCVPYIVVYLADLTFIEEGNPNIIGNNLINFAKYTLIYKVISEVQTYQWSEYNLKPVPIIQTFLKDLNPPSHDDLYKLSLQKEPKGAQKSDIF